MAANAFVPSGAAPRTQVLGLPGAARCHPAQLAGLLRVARPPRGVRQASLGRALGHCEERLERLRVVVHAQPRVADAVQPGRERGDPELVGVDLADLIPAEGSRYLRPWPRADRPRTEHRLMRRILVEVDED